MVRSLDGVYSYIGMFRQRLPILTRRSSAGVFTLTIVGTSTSIFIFTFHDTYAFHFSLKWYRGEVRRKNALLEELPFLLGINSLMGLILYITNTKFYETAQLVCSNKLLSIL